MPHHKQRIYLSGVMAGLAIGAIFGSVLTITGVLLILWLFA